VIPAKEILDEMPCITAPNVPVIARCTFGFGISVTEYMAEDGPRARIAVAKGIITPGYDGPALRDWMQDTAVSWLEQCAPHCLAPSYER
jgi:hypothetical protein